mmetsp:Transcript_6048/g.18306  ORF Transcript_6048/g.18306 Transcript_6048/m.18306 type:complete len:395 (-) Transcript_6048:900-2084(-)
MSLALLRERRLSVSSSVAVKTESSARFMFEYCTFASFCISRLNFFSCFSMAFTEPISSARISSFTLICCFSALQSDCPRDRAVWNLSLAPSPMLPVTLLMTWKSSSNPLSALFWLSNLAETGYTGGSPRPRIWEAFFFTKDETSWTSCSVNSSFLFTTKTIFLLHCLMKVMNLVSLSVKGLSALSVKSTRSALGMKSSVSFCCLSSTTFVPGVSTMVMDLSMSEGTVLRKVPSSCWDISASSPYLIMHTSFVVGTTPVGSKGSLSSALITEDFPALNSPTMTRRMASFRACRASAISIEAFPSWPSMSLGALESTTPRRTKRPSSMASFRPRAPGAPASPSAPPRASSVLVTPELRDPCLASRSSLDSRALAKTLPNLDSASPSRTASPTSPRP